MFKSLIPTLSITIAIVLFIFVSQPQFATISTLNQEISAYKDTTKRYQEFNAELSALMSTKNNIRISDRERIDTMIPTSIDNTRLLVDIEAMAKRNSLLFGNITIETGANNFDIKKSNENVSDTQASNHSTLVTNDISFEVIGTYEQFKSFLSEIESSLTLMEVIKISLKAQNGTFQKYAITVQTYALPNTN